MSLIGLAQSLDRIGQREYPLLRIYIISDIKRVLFKNDIKLFKEYVKENEDKLKQYPVIYKHLNNEIKEYDNN